MELILELKTRNEILFYFGMINLLLAIIFLILSKITFVEISGVNAWYKPTKFALSIGIYVLTIAWFMYYLPQGQDIQVMNWLIVVLLGFEIIYIGLQAGRGELSHFNLSTPFHSMMYGLMGIAATIVSLLTLYIAFRFFQTDFPELPDYYVWAIRLGLILFVLFALEGFVMGSRLSHTIGAEDGGKGLAFLNWSRKFGDPRVAHFIGMHALQVLPLLAWYVLKDLKWIIIVAILYTILSIYVLAQALNGKPFLKFIQ